MNFFTVYRLTALEKLVQQPRPLPYDVKDNLAQTIDIITRVLSYSKDTYTNTKELKTHADVLQTQQLDLMDTVTKLLTSSTSGQNQILKHLAENFGKVIHKP